MQSYRSMPFPKQDRTAVALGFFDGIHLGHQQVIGRTAGQQGLTSCVCTFHIDGAAPGSKQDAPLLCTPETKERLIASLGIELFVSLPFSAIADLTPEDFVRRILHGQLGAGLVCCGYDYTFGKGAAANADILASLCAAYGMRCEIVPPVLLDGRQIASTTVRAMLADGDAEGAARLLGRPFSFDFEVITGRQLGRRLHFPTINQRLPEGFVRPKYGVYFSAALLNGVWRRAVTNIGVKPTVGSDDVLAETYILGCDADLYGQHVEVALHKFMRPEQKFDSLEALKIQIEADVRAVAGMTAAVPGAPPPDPCPLSLEKESGVKKSV